MSRVAENIRMYRARKDISQRELARLTHSHPGSVFKWEDGSVVPGVNKLFAIAEALGVTPNDLVGWTAKN
nr:helix-turn-helix transcriptional regulator [Collinsella urealyticum]